MSGKARRLYRLYNLNAMAYGEPFSMCDFHYKEWTPPVTCFVEKVADGALWPCNQCSNEPEINEDT